jgi:hypothetical protein
VLRERCIGQVPIHGGRAKEALRVFQPHPHWSGGKPGTEPWRLLLAKGQILAVSAYSMHHNPAYWVVCAAPSAADMTHAHA